MLFNSLDFAIFLIIVYTLYWAMGSKRLPVQNLLLLVASYVFYGWWDWRFLALIGFTTLYDFWAAINIDNTQKAYVRKAWMISSIVINLGILCFFKYFNFFIQSWIDMLHAFGYNGSVTTLNIILPVGISFYTFQAMSYTIDVYHERIKPSRNLVSFATYISFFPQLVAGPIERASRFLPQIQNRRVFNYKQSVEGLRLILWGLFKKVVIADSLSPHVNNVFTYYYAETGSSILLGAIMFSIQIYCDFSGYSDIAIGTAKLFGIELSSNFRFPYFSKNIVEFWRRWHISLSQWFRDYVFIPLGGSRGERSKTIRNIIVVFLLSGLWHGANWTFVVWGGLHATVYLLYVYFGANIFEYLNRKLRLPDTLLIIPALLVNIGVIVVSWLVFRADSVNKAYLMVKKMILMLFTPMKHTEMLWYIIPFMIIEYLIRNDERNPIRIKYKVPRYLYYSALIILIMIHGEGNGEQFIYFRF